MLPGESSIDFGRPKQGKKISVFPFHIDILKAEYVAVPTVPVPKNFQVAHFR